MRSKQIVALVAACFVGMSSAVRIVMTRHGEKCLKGSCDGPDSGADLSQDGRDRAQYLAKCFNKPSRAFPDGCSSKTNCAIVYCDGPGMHREKDLAQPLANTIGFPLSSGQIGGDSQFYYNKVKDKINQFAKQGVKSIWVVWEHDNLAKLAPYLNKKANFGSWPKVRSGIVKTQIHRLLTFHRSVCFCCCCTNQSRSIRHRAAVSLATGMARPAHRAATT